MNARWVALTLLLAGCSTHPYVDFLDRFRPGKLGPTAVAPYGGVCVQQGVPIYTAGPTITPIPTPPTLGPGVIPGPSPLPGTPTFPPLPPPPPAKSQL